MHPHFKTGIVVAGSAAFVLMAVNVVSISKSLRISSNATVPGNAAEVVTQAVIPPPVIVTKQNPSGFVLKINTQGNPKDTEYAVFESSTAKWVDPLNKTIASDSPVWAQELGAWDIPRNGIILTGLVPNKAYTFFTKARNTAKEETVFGPAGLGITVYSPDAPQGTTVARVISEEPLVETDDQNSNTNTDFVSVNPAGLNLPGRPTIVRLNPKELRLTINPNGNTTSTTFAIQDAVSGKYVQTNGILGDDPVFRIFLDWGGDSGFVIRTEPNRTYRFQVTAKTIDG